MGKHEKKRKRQKENKRKHKQRKRRNSDSTSSSEEQMGRPSSTSSSEEWVERKITKKYDYKQRSQRNKHDRGKRRETSNSSSSSSGSESEEEWIEKDTTKRKNESRRSNKRKSEKRRSNSSSNSLSSEDKWTEKKATEKSRNETPMYAKSKEDVKYDRDDWMSVALTSNSSHIDRRQERLSAKEKEKQSQQYDPRKNVRELNPYWKHGGDGLPTLTAKRNFAKPDYGDDDYYKSSRTTSNWRKRDSGRYKKPEYRSEHIKQKELREDESKMKTKIESHALPDDKATATSSDMSEFELNEIAAKLIKAEMLGQTSLVHKLKEKLELARQNKKETKETEDNLILVRTDSKGLTMPLQKPKEKSQPSKRKVNTHEAAERSKYYADDGEYSLKDMFQTAKFNSSTTDEKDFMASMMRSKNNEDFDDVFVDKIRNSKNTDSAHKRMRDSAVADFEKNTRVLDNCNKCIQNESMAKNLMISMGETVYLSLPSHEPLTEDHCLLVPIRHVNCSTQLDENEWSEIMDFRKSLTKMFASHGQDVIFYETMYAYSRSHMYITCVPVPKEQGDLAPIYFKKAIEESETEWSVNKKLVNLAGKDVRKAIPKGLPYFFVSFGMTEGFAHVIEDKRDFPKYFASEVIGGILDIPHTIWRQPKEQDFKKQQSRVLQFSKIWSEYDCTRH